MIKFISINTAVMFALQSVVSLNMFRLVETCSYLNCGMAGF